MIASQPTSDQWHLSEDVRQLFRCCKSFQARLLLATHSPERGKPGQADQHRPPLLRALVVQRETTPPTIDLFAGAVFACYPQKQEDQPLFWRGNSIDRNLGCAGFVIQRVLGSSCPHSIAAGTLRLVERLIGRQH